MTKYKVKISKKAAKQLQKTEEPERIKKKLRKLKKEPWKPRAKLDIKKIKGSKNPKLYRLRIGDYRAIYVIQDEKVKITEIIHRSKGYDFLE